MFFALLSSPSNVIPLARDDSCISSVLLKIQNFTLFRILIFFVTSVAKLIISSGESNLSKLNDAVFIVALDHVVLPSRS